MDTTVAPLSVVNFLLGVPLRPTPGEELIGMHTEILEEKKGEYVQK